MQKKVLYMINDFSKGIIKPRNSEQNLDASLSLEQINLGDYQNKKDEIINKLRSTMTRIENFDIEKAKEEIIKNIQIRIKDCINDLLIKALHSTQFGKHIRNISNNFEDVMDKIL